MMENQRRKQTSNLNKVYLHVLKRLPILLALISLMSTLLNSLNLNTKVLNYMNYILIYLFIYLASYVFKFCNYHRMFLHYILCVNLIAIYDCHIGIAISNLAMLYIYLIVTGLFLLITLYLYVKYHKIIIKSNINKLRIW